MQLYPSAVVALHSWHLMGTLIFFSCLLSQLCAFNLDTENPVIYTGPKGSNFGFSVEFYMPEAGTRGVLIGAPKANTTQEKVTEGGAVFHCPWSSNGSLCTLIPFDNKGDRYINRTYETLMEDKSNQWFGATVKAHKDKIVACAPMYRWKYVKSTYTGDLTSGSTPVGSCLIASKNFSTYAEYSPCRSNLLEVQIKNGPDQRFCEAGWSSELTKGGKLLLGAPGSFFWQGQLIAANVDDILKNYNYNDPLKVLGMKEQTGDAKGKRDNIFMGYSLALGEFTGDSINEYLVGAPRDKHTLGSVTILWSNMTAIKSIIGEQVAAYFGYTVTVLDINSDGRDDILVGAPLFMNRGQDGKLHELGRMYIYLQEEPGVFIEPPQTLTGTDKYGRFGSAITSLGDLDYDGYKDVAVGAPFAGEDGKGRVFVYLGHTTGLYQKPFQELQGSWTPDVISAGFGFALKGGSDIDENNFPDLIVGAHDADNVLVYRAKPVVAANVKLTLEPDILNPEFKACLNTKSGTSIPVTCFKVQMCAEVQGHDIVQQYVLNAQVELDKNKHRSQRRTFFLHSHQTEERFPFPPIKNKQQFCKNFTAYLKDEAEFKDKLSPIVVTMNCSLAEVPLSSSGTLPMVLSPHSKVLVTEKARILLHCGDDHICIPNLNLSATVDEDHIFAGESSLLTVFFNAVNLGEGAYETELHIPLPPQVDFISVVRGDKSLTKLSCNPVMSNGSQAVSCDLGNPMENGTKISAGLHFTVHSLEQVETITISMQIKSKNTQNSDSEVVQVKLQVKAVAQLVLRGVSQPNKVFLPFISLESPSDTVMENNTLQVIAHTYELHNNGPSTISKALIELDWPADFNGDDLLFTSKFEPWGEIKCTVNSSNADKWVQPLSTVKPHITNIRREMNKRDVSKPEILMEETIFNLTCDTVTCVKLFCEVGRLERQKAASISIQSSLRVEPFIKKLYKQYIFQSKASFIVQEMPYKVRPDEFPRGNIVVQTVIESREDEGAGNVPVWCIIVAVIGGLLLVALVTFILWKCGFFKRKLPPTENEELL
ncbi:integrin alpha-8-like [Hypanus sabinus]|uniref:integrin alpha-8-like n=1 Tax=Hypanus sabinus TaxID=79690 RepID=UPI0028C3CD01|nr:integrin alpha-8-like [Hypanus sabinus]